MKKFAIISLAVAALSLPAIANAQTSTAPASPSAATAAPATAPAAAAAAALAPTAMPPANAAAPVELKDGSWAKVAPDGTVTVSSDAGKTWAPAPDGTWASKDGLTTITVKGGKKV